MSSSPTASIIYGVRLGFRDEDDVRFSKDPDMLDETRDDEDLEEALDEFIEERQVKDEARVEVFGSYEYPGYILGFDVGGAGDWDCAELPDLTIDPTWDQQIKDLAERLGVDISDKPIGWHVAAFYG